MRIELQQSVTAQDLARALEGDEGTFLAQSGGQNFIVTASAGHSIKSIRAVGRRVTEAPSSALGSEWHVTKLSNSQIEDVAGNYGEQQSRSATR